MAVVPGWSQSPVPAPPTPTCWVSRAVPREASAKSRAVQQPRVFSLPSFRSPTLVFWHLTGKTARYVWLAISGYVFYSFWNYKFCALMFFSTAVSYLAGLGLLRCRILGAAAVRSAFRSRQISRCWDSSSTPTSWSPISTRSRPGSAALDAAVSQYRAPGRHLVLHVPYDHLYESMGTGA